MSLIAGIAMVVGGVVKGASGSMQRNTKLSAANERYGANLADVEYRTAQHVTASQEAARLAGTNANLSMAQIQINEQQAKADAQVSAAAVGAEGGSVDMGIAEVAANADRAMGQTRLSLEAEQKRIQARASDAIAGETSRKGKPPSERGTNTGLFGALGGLLAYGRLQL